MDLRRIVEEVEERKREEYALMAPPKAHAKTSLTGVTASILEHVRDRMLREDPGADVRSINEVIEPEGSAPAPCAPTARFKAEPIVATVAREAARRGKRAPSAAEPSRKRRDDFLARYLVMSEEFQMRYKVKGWTALVRKKCSSELRP